MRVPDTYYAELADRFRDVDLDLDSLAELGVLADRDDEGHLCRSSPGWPRIGRQCSSS